MAVSLIAVCEGSRALSHWKELSPVACFQDWNRNVPSWEWVSAREGQCSGHEVAQTVKHARKLGRKSVSNALITNHENENRVALIQVW